MSQETITTLLQVVALTLPAVGIYLQVLRNLHRPAPNETSASNVDRTNMKLDFNLAKLSILIITASGIINIVYLLIIEFPTLNTGLGPIVLPLLVILSLIFIGSGLFFFAGSVYFSFGAPPSVGQNPSTIETISTFLTELWNRINM